MLPPFVLSRADERLTWGLALAVLALAQLTRIAASDLARGYVGRRLCSVRYLAPALGFPLASAALIARAGVLGAVVVAAIHLGLAHLHRARFVRPGALRGWSSARDRSICSSTASSSFGRRTKRSITTG
jgi:hypothetical protein